MSRASEGFDESFATMKNVPFPYQLILPASLGVLLASLLFGSFIEDNQLVIGVVMILLLGIPHGSTDYKIYQVTRNDQELGMLSFIFVYLLIMAVYGLFWWAFPAFSLIIFLLISLYHFGESNWHRSKLSAVEKFIIYMIYGLFFLASPILLNWRESRTIIMQILDVEAGFNPPEIVFHLPNLLYVQTVVVIIYLYLKNKVDRKVAILELISVTLLFILYYQLPLLPAFAIYFVFWHSIVSMKDQKEAIALVESGYSWKNYLRDALPFSFAAISSLVLLAFFVPDFATRYVSLLFILISMLTMPHMILIENLIQKVPLRK